MTADVPDGIGINPHGSDEPTDIVSRSIARWQTRMLQLDRNNNLLYFPARTRPVGIIEDNFDEFLVSIASRRGLRFTYAQRVPGSDKPYVDEGEIDTDVPPLELQKRLRALKKRSKEYSEEQGLNVLFVAVGFLNWIDEDNREARAPSLWFRAS